MSCSGRWGGLGEIIYLKILAQSESSGNILSAATVAVHLSTLVQTCVSTSPLCSSQLRAYPAPQILPRLLTFLLQLGYFSLHLSHFLAHPVHPQPSGAPTLIPAASPYSCPVFPPTPSKSESTILQEGCWVPTWLPNSELLRISAELYSQSRVVKGADLVPGHQGANSRSTAVPLPAPIPAFTTSFCQHLHVFP